MASIKTFEDLEVWQLARELEKIFKELLKTSGLKNDFALADQMRRASNSIKANISEGFERNGNKEFINFLFIAKASAGEFRSHLYSALDGNLINKLQFEEHYKLCCRISGALYNLIQYLKNSNIKGLRFKS